MFVHGNPTWSFAWRRAIRKLSQTRRCIAPDHVGCGLSDKPQAYAYRLEQHIENLERLLAELDPGRVTLILHDWGGAIGLGWARRHAARVARIAVLNTAAFPSKAMPWRIALCRVPLFGKLAVRGFNGFARGATWMAVEKPLDELAKRGYLLPYDSWENRIATHAFVEDIPMQPGHPSWTELCAIESALESFRDRPAAILWGDRDWCFSPRFREEWQRRWPQARVRRYLDAGHYVFEDAGDEIVWALQEFLSDHPVP